MFGELKQKIKILVISNKYKNTLDVLVNSLDIEHSIKLKSVCKVPCNIIIDLKDLLIKSKLDRNFLDSHCDINNMMK